MVAVRILAVVPEDVPDTGRRSSGALHLGGATHLGDGSRLGWALCTRWVGVVGDVVVLQVQRTWALVLL